MELAGRRVLITGASRGIGQALAERFAAAGSHVVLVARSEGPLKELADRLGGTAHPCDLSDPELLAGLVARVEADGGPIDVVVNNAGIDTTGAFAESSAHDVEFLYRVNVIAPVEITRQALPGMIERGRGHLVYVSSLAGVGAFPGMAMYASSKAAVNHFTAGLRADLRGTPVGTTLVEVGLVPATAMADSALAYPPTKRAFDHFYRLRLLADVPIARLADDVVDATRHGRRHVRLPKRALLFPVLGEAPRRIVEVMLTGVNHQED